MAIQELTQPIINPIAAFDATREHEITFIAIGGAQVTGNRIVISDNQTGNVVYNNIANTMKLAHTIPANTLSNGKYYNAVIYTIDSSASQSSPSTPVPFYCYSQPTLTITNVPATETIGNGTYEFQGNYLQSEGEQLNSYQFILYDSNKDILDKSDIIYYQSNDSLAYTFIGMDNDTSYYVELKGQTVNNTEITSGLIYFTVRYTQLATFAIVDLINDCENGYIQISSNIVAIDGKSNPEPPIYIDDKEVDLRDKDSWVKWDEGFNINNDFTMRVWGRDFNDYERIISLANKENTPDNPNKIEMKWMIADVIETLPSYTSVSGKNVSIKNGFKTDIEDLEIMGNSEQISKEPVDLGTGNYIKAETTRDMYLDIQVQGNQYQKTQEGSKQSASGTEVYLTGVDSSKPADIVVNGNNYQETREGYNLFDVLGLTLQNQDKGVTIDRNDDGYIIANGTPTGSWSGYLKDTKLTEKLEDGETYILWQENYSKVNNGGIYLQVIITPISGGENIYINSAMSKKTFKVDKSKYTYQSVIQISTLEVAGTFDNYKNRYMIYKGTDAKKFELYGASPSPDYPSEIQTVGSIKNILNMSGAKGGTNNGITCTVNEDGSYSYVGTASNVTINVWLLGAYFSTTPIFILEPGTYYINDVLLFENTGALNENPSKKVWTFINSHEITGVRTPSAEINKVYNEIKYPIIAKVDHIIPWVPYNYGSVQVNVQNKNYLANIAQSSVTENGITTTYDGEKFLCKGTTTSSFFGISKKTNIYLPIGTYTFSQNAISRGRFVLRLYYRDNTFSTHYISTATWRVSFTTSKEAVFFGIFCDSLSSGINIDYTVYVQLESGRTNTDWIKPEIQQIILPIQQEMLANDYIKRAEHHEWGKVIFNGTENWGMNYGTGMFHASVFQVKDVNSRLGMSNYFKYNTANASIYNYLKDSEFAIQYYEQSKNTTIFMKNLSITTVADWKAWLKSKYDSGNPVVVYYKLATPTDLVLTDIQKTAQAQLTNMTIYQDITNITNESSYPAILNVDYNITRAMPSPEAPSEVETVGDNVNYFDKDSVTNTLIILDSGNLYPNDSWRTTDFIEVTANTYTLSWESTTDYFQCNIAFYDKDKKYLSYIQYTNRTFSNTFDIKDNAKYMRVSYSVKTDVTSITREKIKLEIGNKKTLYSPFGMGSVETNIVSKNLINPEINAQLSDIQVKNQDDFIIINGNNTHGQQINFKNTINYKPNKTYTATITKVSGSCTAYSPTGAWSLLFYPYKGSINLVIFPNSTTIKLSFDSPNGKFTPYFWFGWDNNTSIVGTNGVFDNYVFKVQIEEGNKSTDYVKHEEQSYIMPVQKPMLIGDYISDIEHGGWEKIVIDNTAPLVAKPTQKSGSPRYSIVLSNFIGKNFKNSSTSNEAIAYSNIFPLIQKGKTYLPAQGFTIIDSKIYIYDEGESLDAFKQFLTDNPLIVYAQLATSENLPLTTEQQTIQSTLKPAYTDITNIYATEDLPILKASTLRVPSPSVPSPIYSSGDQRNLLEDLGAFDISYTQDYFKITDTTFKLKPNFVYNLSFDYIINTASTDLYFTVCYKNGSNITDITGTVLYYNQATGRSNTSFMVPEDIPNNSTLSIKFVRTLIPANVNVSISNVQLEKGRVAHDYQKHGLYNIYPTAVQKNIFDYDKIYYVENKNTEISYIQNGISANLAGTNETAYIAIGFPNILQPGQNYAISYNSYGELLSSKLYTMNKETGERVEEITLDNGSFTAPSNVYDFLFEFTLNDTIENNQVQIWNIQIEAGDQVTEYEVYKPNQTIITLQQPLRAIGNYKDIICLESPNLLNPQTQVANVKGGQNYYLSQSGTTQYQLDYLTEYGNLISSVNISSGKITVPDTCVQIKVNASSSDITSNKLQINEGATAEIYYPYVSEPSVIRYIEELKLDGGISDDASYAKSSVTTDIDRFTIVPNALAPNTILGTGISLSNYFYFSGYGSKEVPSFYTDRAGSTARPFRIIVNYTTQGTTLDDFKSWVNSKYKEENPLIFYHIVENPTVYKLSSENISALKGLKTYEGTSNVFTNNNIPANINFSYISGQSEQEAKNAYVTLKCWNGNVMPYFVHSNYIDIPKETDKVFIWVRKKNNIFDLKIENLGDYQGEET